MCWLLSCWEELSESSEIFFLFSFMHNLQVLSHWSRQVVQDQREHHFMDLLEYSLGTESDYILQGVFCIKIRGLGKVSRV